MFGLSQLRGAFLAEAEKQGLVFHQQLGLSAALRNWKVLDGGLMLLSRYPIAASSSIVYSESVHADALVGKGMLYAKVRVGATQDACVHIFTSHTQASYGTPADQAFSRLPHDLGTPPPLTEEEAAAEAAEAAAAQAALQRRLSEDPLVSANARRPSRGSIATGAAGGVLVGAVVGGVVGGPVGLLVGAVSGGVSGGIAGSTTRGTKPQAPEGHPPLQLPESRPVEPRLPAVRRLSQGEEIGLEAAGGGAADGVGAFPEHYSPAAVMAVSATADSGPGEEKGEQAAGARLMRRGSGEGKGEDAADLGAERLEGAPSPSHDGDFAGADAAGAAAAASGGGGGGAVADSEVKPPAAEQKGSEGVSDGLASAGDAKVAAAATAALSAVSTWAAEGGAAAPPPPSLPRLVPDLRSTAREREILETVMQDSSTRVRQGQMREANAFIREMVRLHGPELPVYVMGDLNVDARTHPEEELRMAPGQLPGYRAVPESVEYREMVRRLSKGAVSFTDLLKENYGLHPVTFGDCVNNAKMELLPAEVALTDPEDHFKLASYDYILHMTFSTQARHSTVQTVPNTATVEPFFIPNQPFTQLSDHYGVKMVLRYHAAGSEAPPGTRGLSSALKNPVAAFRNYRASKQRDKAPRRSSAPPKDLRSASQALSAAAAEGTSSSGSSAAVGDSLAAAGASTAAAATSRTLSGSSSDGAGAAAAAAAEPGTASAIPSVELGDSDGSGGDGDQGVGIATPGSPDGSPDGSSGSEYESESPVTPRSADAAAAVSAGDSAAGNGSGATDATASGGGGTRPLSAADRRLSFSALIPEDAQRALISAAAASQAISAAEGAVTRPGKDPITVPGTVSPSQRAKAQLSLDAAAAAEAQSNPVVGAVANGDNEAAPAMLSPLTPWRSPMDSQQAQGGGSSTVGQFFTQQGGVVVEEEEEHADAMSGAEICEDTDLAAELAADAGGSA